MLFFVDCLKTNVVFLQILYYIHEQTDSAKPTDCQEPNGDNAKKEIYDKDCDKLLADWENFCQLVTSFDNEPWVNEYTPHFAYFPIFENAFSKVE